MLITREVLEVKVARLEGVDASSQDATNLQLRLDQYAQLDPPYPCWLSGEADVCWIGSEKPPRTADNGLNYCLQCAEKRLAAGEGEFIDGGYGAMEEDTPCHCEDCGALLDYTLTDYGVDYELEHFNTVRFRGDLSRDDAFAIARMIGANPTQEVVRLARRALRHIPDR